MSMTGKNHKGMFSISFAKLQTSTKTILLDLRMSLQQATLHMSTFKTEKIVQWEEEEGEKWDHSYKHTIFDTPV